MIIYEVNLTINNKIFNEYYLWLIDHVKEILKIKGFIKADIAKEKNNHESLDHTHVTVRYMLHSEMDLENYLNHQAPSLRKEALQKFGDQFTASRRVFVETMNIC